MSTNKGIECPECSILTSNIECMRLSLDEMGDRIRDLHDEMLRLQSLLTKNNISFEVGL